jgi:hypothetical protein
MKFDPKLKKAMNEIMDVLNKYDINGSIVLHSPGFGEHFMKVDASYSCAKVEQTIKGPAIRIKAKSDEIKRMEDTVNSIVIMNDLMDYHQNICHGVMDALSKKLDIDNSESGHSTDQDLYN